MLTSLLLLYGLLPVTILGFLIVRLRSPIAKIPGPFYTKFTSLILMYNEFTHARRLYIHELHEKYGPTVRLGPNEVSFATIDAMKEIYMSGGSGYDRTELYSLFKQFGTRTLFSTPPRSEHAYMKRYMADRYANTTIMKSESISGIDDLTKDFLVKCLDKNATDGYADIYVHLHCFALDGATHHLFHPYGTHSLRNEKDKMMMEELSYHDSLPRYYLKYYAPSLTPLVHRFFPPKPAPISNSYVLNTSKAPEPASFSLLSKLQSHAKTNTMPEFGIPAECMDHLAAGVDTTGDALCFLMYQLSNSPGIQELLHKELVENPEEFDKLPYLDAVVKEGLRCFPPIPMSFPRYVPEGGRSIEGYNLPAGTIVSSQPWTIHKNQTIFPKPLEFIPERWMEKEGETERNRWFFAFSSGGRGCLGKHLAIAEMKLLLKQVYSQCRTTVSKEMNGDMQMQDQIIATRPKGQTCKLVFERI